MTTPYLEATEISASQASQYVTSNELDRVLEQLFAVEEQLIFPPMQIIR